MKNKIWMKVTKDKYELPVAVAESIPELARLTGQSEKSLYSIFCRKRKGSKRYPGYVEVKYED